MRTAASDSLRRNRDFQIYCTGQGFSMLGSAASGLALPLLVLSSTGSPFQAGLVEAVWTGALALACLPGGTIADRFDRRTTLLCCELGRTAASGLLAAAVLTGHTALPLLLAVGAVLGALTAPAIAAGLAALTRIVPADKLSSAIAVNRVRGQGAYLLGPMLGGWLFTVSPSLPFWLDALSFAISGVSVYFVRTPLSVPAPAAGEPAPERGWLRESGAALRPLWADRVLRRLTLLAAGQNLVLDGAYLAVVVVSSRAGSTGLSVGAIAAVSAVGALAGVLVAPWLGARWSPGTVLTVGGTACAVLVCAMALGTGPALLAPLLGGCSMAVALSGSLITLARMVRTPAHLQGRVHSASGLLLMAAPPLGSTLTGGLLEQLPAPAVFLLLGALLVPLAAATPQIRAADLAAPVVAAPDTRDPHRR
ncbi:MFS transporter [Streptomyces sp. NPDC093544]|jgi:MFS family permease|uniref:MFS transporter n=1 Tax=Streptomyces sp. NPDC093544 TaxID=3155200 RepID=UPI00343DB756